MDPISVYRMGLLRQQEILEWAAKEQGGKSVRWYVSELGGLLYRLGERLENAANPVRQEQASVNG